MVGNQPETGAHAAGLPYSRSLPDWRKRMSNQVAYALLVYTALQIFLTMGALQGRHGSLLPYAALILLVGAIIPACRGCDRRWRELDEGAAHDPALARAYCRDRRALWAMAIGLPLAMTALLRLLGWFFTR
jgi:hypothetical protein